MGRKDLFLNNDLSMMMSRELNPEPDFGKEWQEEQERFRKEAENIVKNPAGSIDAKALMDRSGRYADTEEYYQKLFIWGTDEEQLQDLKSLEYAATMTLLPEAVVMAGWDLIDKEDYAGWMELMYALHYVPLQKALCYCVTSHKDFIGILKPLDVKRLAYPQTFLWSLLDHWLEWLIRAGGHLLSYTDEKGFHIKNKKAQALMAEGRAIKEEWEQELPGLINEILAEFAKYLQPSKLLAWATKEPLRDDAASNPYSANYNHCINLICSDLSQTVNLYAIPEEDVNLNMILLIASKAIRDNDIAFGKSVYDRLVDCLKFENFSNTEKKSELDEKRQRVIAQLIILVSPDLDITACISDVATRFQGWNLDCQQLYSEARREAFMICSLFRVFELKPYKEDELFTHWKSLIDAYRLEYKRCENEYIQRDDFTVPFRVAVEVAEQLNNESCREYLHDVMLEYILSIVSLLTVFSECEMHLYDKTVVRLNERIANEWPSAKMLMEVRGQRLLESRIENLIGQLRGFVKE